MNIHCLSCFKVCLANKLIKYKFKADKDQKHKLLNDYAKSGLCKYIYDTLTCSLLCYSY